MNKIHFLIILLLGFVSCGEDPLSFKPTTDYQPVVSDITDIDGINDTYGKITDEDGTPIANVVVTDGYAFSTTDESGVYQFKRDKEARFVYYSNPSGYEITTENAQNKMALFYSKISPNTKGRIRHDFVLKKSPTSQQSFTLIAIGDPQVANDAEISRFREETIADIRETLQALQTPAIGLSLGDVVADKSDLLVRMKGMLGSTEMPVFTTIGNHDKFPTSTEGVKVNDAFENIFGPQNYSFNYGDVHFVCLDNVKFTNQSNYNIGITDQQIEWLAKDLSYVPTSKMIVMYYHMPMRNTNFTNKTALLNLLKDYANVHFMVGHTHYNENYIHSSPTTMYEHIHGATCGAWWKSTINGDGTPNGYAVYSINGTAINNWYYKSVKYDKDFQIRLHRGDATFGGDYGMHGYGLTNDVLIANIWNADPNWQIEVYENGTKTGNMTLSSLTQDAWSKGYHLGVLNRNPDNYSTRTTHLYRYTLQNPAAQVRVVATDSFGNVYEQTNWTTDLATAIAY